MRIRLEFTDGLLRSTRGVPADEVEKTLVDELSQFGAVEPVFLIANATDFQPGENADLAWEIRTREERAWCVEISTERLCEYLSETWRTAVLLPTARWHQCSRGPDVSHVLLIAEDKE